MRRLEGKRAIVTGAASGIGRASALRFASEGARVIAVDLAEETVQETADLIRKDGGEALALVADAADEAAVKHYVGTCVGEFGGVDVVYANAGIGGTGPDKEFDVDGWLSVLRVNLLGPMLAIKHASPHMIEQGSGSIICTASTAGLRANAGGLAYSASKAGVVSLVQTSSFRFYGTGVRVNAICPGLTETGMTKPLFDMSRARGSDHKIGQLNPLGRYGLPDEIAGAALFLASDDSSYVNGQALAVCGGLSASHPFVPPKRERPA